MRKSLLLFILIVFSQGCTAKYYGTGGSFVGELPSDVALIAISQDVVMMLSQENAPGHTDIKVLTPNKKENPIFSQILETELRQKGFTLSENADLEIGYILDRLTSNEFANDGSLEELFYIQLRYNDTITSKIYDALGKSMGNWTRTTAPIKRKIIDTEKLKTIVMEQL